MGSDPLSLDEAVHVQSKVIEAIRLHKSKRVLFEKGGEQRKLKMQDYYALAESFGKLISGLRFAILVSPKLQTPEVAFFELASGSAGNVLRYFNNFEQAEAWLKES